MARAVSQAQTRAALIEAAREAFLAHGIDGASLAQIAEAAGCTTGAVYANFPGKDDLFLAVLDARAGSVQGQALIVEAGLSMDDSLRAIARFLLSEFEEDPRWAPLVAEYWARAARNPDFRAAAVRRHADIIEAISALIEQLAGTTCGSRSPRRRSRVVATRCRAACASSARSASTAPGSKRSRRCSSPSCAVCCVRRRRRARLSRPDNLASSLPTGARTRSRTLEYPSRCPDLRAALTLA